MNKKMSIREFAKAIGVSPATVSKALSSNVNYRISPAKSAYIKEQARELGFQLTPSLKTIEKCKTLRIGLVCGSAFSFLGGFLWEGARDYCSAHNVKLLFDSCGHLERLENEALRQMTQENVDAMIYWPAARNEKKSNIQRIISRTDNVAESMPLIYLGETSDCEQVFSLRFREQEAAVQAAERQLALGCKKFIIMRFEYVWDADSRAEKEYRNTLLAHGVPARNIKTITAHAFSDAETMAAFKNADGVWVEHVFLLFSHLEWITKFTNPKRLHVDGLGFAEFALTFQAFLQPTFQARGIKGSLENLYGSSGVKLCSLRKAGALAAQKALELVQNSNLERGGVEYINWLTPEEAKAAEGMLRQINYRKANKNT